MAARSLPGIGLVGFWNTGAAYKTDMDANLRLISALLQGRVLSRLSSVPGGPSNGDIYILTAGAHEDEIAVRDNSAWVYITPQTGWRMYDIDAGLMLEFVGGDWRPVRVRLFPTGTELPVTNGELTFQVNSNTEVAVRLRGTDGTVREALLTLS